MSTEHTPQPQDHTWATHLARLEGALDDARGALLDPAHPEVVLDGQALIASRPQDPLDGVDAERARELLARLHDLVDALETARRRVSRELQLHRRLAAGRQDDTGALYLDAHC